MHTITIRFMIDSCGYTVSPPRLATAAVIVGTYYLAWIMPSIAVCHIFDKIILIIYISSNYDELTMAEF
jgi:hypothetical protein